MTSTFGTRLARRDRWEDRGLAAALLRATVTAGPLLASVAVGMVVGWAIAGDSALDIVGRVGAAGLASVVTFVVVEWAARRLLPLAVLLRLSLVFPDHAPSRFAVALRSTSVRRLREWARTNHDPLDAQALAEKVLTLASALNFHDRRTRGHSERTRALAELVIDELGLTEAQANEVRWGAFLHDIGKLLVPAEILNKPGALTPAEWEQLRRHPAEGGRLVHPLRPFIGSGVDAVACHHEFFDGTGYPNGLQGEEIPLSARIVAVVDSFEVMTAVRSYKRPISATAAREELVRVAGSQFDPQVVRAFVNVSLGRVHWTIGLVAWIAELPFIGIVPRAAAQVGAVVGAGGSAVSTATLASVATATLGASLMVNPLAASAPAPAAAPAARPPAATAAAPGADGRNVATGWTTRLSPPASAATVSTGAGSRPATLPTVPVSATTTSPVVTQITAPGLSGTAPGLTGTAPGLTGTAPGHSGIAPGLSGTAPGLSGTAPGHSGTAPGLTGTAPGLTGTAPGHSGTAPGHSGTAPGLTGTAPGLTGTAPGLSGTAPGHQGATSGHAGTTPGHTTRRGTP